MNKYKEKIIKERDDCINELLKDDHTNDPITFKELAKTLRDKGHKISNKELLEKYREIRLYNKIEMLKKSVEMGRMQKITAKRLKEQMKEYYKKGYINRLNDLYGRLYDVENNPSYSYFDF
jgi:RNA polymerase-interacting CarD/CdnL/TRCF family regulator